MSGDGLGIGADCGGEHARTPPGAPRPDPGPLTPTRKPAAYAHFKGVSRFAAARRRGRKMN